jgi:hypothetical protein
MTEQALRLQEELLRLPIEDRLEIAHILWESVEPPPGKVYETEEDFIAELDLKQAYRECCGGSNCVGGGAQQWACAA